ncbi:MAG: hypothetical protein FJX64_06795 [Alphaproteobacteria bacterium]|nr:hypothetical protein [Alphaproteobacteria bacterium]
MADRIGPRAPKHAVLALLVAALVIALQIASARPREPYADEYRYLNIASGLVLQGVFGDGADFDAAPIAPDRKYGPLYPAFLAGLMVLDGKFAASVACFREHRNDDTTTCPRSYGLAVPIQGMLAAIASFGTWLIALLVTGRRAVAWVAMAIALLSGEFAAYATMFLTENLVLPLFVFGTLAALAAARRPTTARLACAGALLGVLTLVRAEYALLGAGALATAAVAAMIWRANAGQIARGAVVAVAAALVVAGPWIIRNQVTFHAADRAGSYGSRILAQRLAYNEMTTKEWAVAFVYWLPDFGDNLAGALFGGDSFRRLSLDGTDTLYELGRAELLANAVTQAGAEDQALGYLVRTGILAQPLWHVAVTFALLWRGIWVAKYWGLITVPIFAFVLASRVRRRDWTFVLLAAPAWFMAGLYAFASISISRYNLVLIPCLAVATAMALVPFVAKRWEHARIRW